MERRGCGGGDDDDGGGGEGVTPGCPAVPGRWVQSCPAGGSRRCLHR